MTFADCCTVEYAVQPKDHCYDDCHDQMHGTFSVKLL